MLSIGLPLMSHPSSMPAKAKENNISMATIELQNSLRDGVEAIPTSVTDLDEKYDERGTLITPPLPFPPPTPSVSEIDPDLVQAFSTQEGRRTRSMRLKVAAHYKRFLSQPQSPMTPPPISYVASKSIMSMEDRLWDTDEDSQQIVADYNTPDVVIIPTAPKIRKVSSAPISRLIQPGMTFKSALLAEPAKPEPTRETIASEYPIVGPKRFREDAKEKSNYKPNLSRSRVLVPPTPALVPPPAVVPRELAMSCDGPIENRATRDIPVGSSKFYFVPLADYLGDRKSVV